ncbi:MAG: ABC transporter ATP-binding protein [Aeropyrum sp.]|nr:ABC transporter ATP-binding protein [Aeropyrum sp.]
MDKNHCGCSYDSVVCLCGVEKSIKGRQVLRGVDLEVDEGEIHILAGLNGAGKTTTVRIIVGLVVRDGGFARVLGEDPGGGGFARVRGMIGYLPEDASVYDRLTGLENIEFYARLYGGPVEEMVERAMMYSGLSIEDLSRRAGGYSKGMKRRLLLGITLMTEPSLVVLDEPTSGIDPIASHRVKRLLRRLAAKGRSLLVTTHDMRLAEEIGDRVTIIHRGSTLESGSPGELMDRYGAESLEEVFVRVVEGVEA